MADNNRNRGGYGSHNQDWNESGRYGRELSNDDRSHSGNYGGRYEGGQGNYGNQSSRYNRSYDEGNLYGSSRYDRDIDYNRSSSYGNSQFERYDRDRDYSNYGSSSENRGRDYGSSNYGNVGDRNFGGSRYDRDYQGYTPGRYQNYGGSSGYGGSYFGGGHGDSGSYGSHYGSGYTSGLGNTYGSGSTDRGRWDYDQQRGSSGMYGSTYGRSNYGRSNQGEDRGWWDRTTDEISSWFGNEEAERRRDLDRQRTHRGRGPRNYQRSDERIKEDINDRLSDDWFVDASEIDVAVQNGEVTLTGRVDARSTKRRVEDIVEAVSGVRNVENRLRVSNEVTSDYSSGSSSGIGSTGTERSKSSRQSSLVGDINSK